MIGKIVLLRRYAERSVNLFGIFFVIKIMRKYKMQTVRTVRIVRTVVLRVLLDSKYERIQSEHNKM